jgi:(p)ppGpp synthase/HD superfamily hydrolase
MNERGARLIAKLAHKGQKYGNDDYYEAHVRPLVEMVRVAGGNVHAIHAAYLHDVVEDTEATLDDLIDAGRRY